MLRNKWVHFVGSREANEGQKWQVMSKLKQRLSCPIKELDLDLIFSFFLFFFFFLETTEGF